MAERSRIAIVTGAGTGVGRSAALSLLKAGWSVGLAGRRLEPLEETALMAGDNSARALPVPTDVSDPAAVDALFAATVEKFGRLDLLFNNAGIGAPAVPMDELDVQDWLDVVSVNLTGPFLCTRAAFGIMRHQDPQGGRIINNGSISAYVPRPFSVAYTSTKHAITGLTRTTSLDGRPYNIACGQIDIGNAATPMTDRMVAGPGVPQADLSMAIEPRMDVEHVGNAIVNMAELPLDANVQFMTIMSTTMPFIGRG